MSPIHFTHKGLLFALSCSYEAKTTRLVCDCSPFDRSAGRFAQPNPLSLSLSGRFRLVSCRAVSDLTSGIEVPAIVLRREESAPGAKSYTYCLLSVGFNQIHVCCSFVAKTKLERNTCLPACGPRVIFIDNGVMNITLRKPSSGGLNHRPVCDTAVETLIDVAHAENTYLIAATQSCSSQPGAAWSNTSVIFTIAHTDDNRGRVTECILHTSTIVPSLYFPHITTLKVIDLEVHKRDSTVLGAHIDTELNDCRYQLTTYVIAVTDSYQVVVFQDGLVSDVFNLPSLTGSVISLQVWHGWKNQEYAAVLTSTGEVHVMSLCQCQVVSQYSAVQGIHVSDFLGNGTEQCLLIHQTAGESHSSLLTQSQLTLIDGAHCWFSPAQQEESPTNEDGAAESIMRAQRALSLRLQSGFHDVESQHHQFRMMTDFIQESVNLLSDLALDQKCRRQSPHTNLLPFLGGDPGQLNQPSSGQLLRQKSPLHVTQKWQKVVDDQWVIGLGIMNDTDHVLENVQLVTLNKDSDGEHESVSKFVKITSLTSDSKHLVTHPEIPAKKRKVDPGRPHVEVAYNLNPREKGTILSLRKLPEFYAANKAEVELLVVWNEKTVTEEGDEKSKKMCGRRAKLWCAGKMEICTQNIHAGEVCLNLSNKGDIKDLLALTAYQVAIPMTLTCVLSTSKSLQTCLESSLGFNFLASLDQWLCVRHGLLYLSRVDICKQTLRSCTLICFIRDSAQFFHLLHALYEALPDDVIILPPGSDGNLSDIVSHVLNHMESELSYSSKTLQNIISESEKIGTETKQEEMCFDVKTKQQMFKEQQHQFHLKHDAVVSGETLAAFKESLEIKQRKTNNALLKMGLSRTGT